MTVYYHQYDLPADALTGNTIAIDTETMGLNPNRDRLCVVQLSNGNGDAHVVHFPEPRFDAPNLKALLSSDITALYHFGRFDIATIYKYLGVLTENVFCTKIASKLVRTYTDRHGLKALCQEVLGVELSKQQQSSDWGAPTLTEDQQNYAASDVLYLHQLQEQFIIRLARENRTEIAQSCFDFLPKRAQLDLMGWETTDIFSH